MFESSGEVAQRVSAADCVGELHVLIDTLASLDAGPGHGGADGELVVEVTTAIRRLESVRAAAADRFHQGGEYTTDGSRSSHAWIAAKVNEGWGACRSMVRTGGLQRIYPQMGAAFAAGEITREHLLELDRTHGRYPRLRQLLIAEEHTITDYARDCTAKQFSDFLRILTHRLDPAAAERDDEDRRGQCHLHASTVLDGLVKIDALLPADMGQQFLALMESAHRAVKKLTFDDAEVDAPNERRLGSTHNLESFQRLMDAAASLDATDPQGLPPIQGARPVIHASISVETLMNDTERTAGFLDRLGMRSPVLSTITTANAVDRMLCDGIVNPYVVNAQGQMIASLPANRTVPPHLRKAIQIRDRHCRFTGCTSRIDEAHHIIFARHGGQTEMTNLIGLCWHHHHLIHHLPWTLTGNANREVLITNTLTNQKWRSPPRTQQRC